MVVIIGIFAVLVIAALAGLFFLANGTRARRRAAGERKTLGEENEPPLTAAGADQRTHERSGGID